MRLEFISAESQTRFFLGETDPDVVRYPPIQPNREGNDL